MAYNLPNAGLAVPRTELSGPGIYVKDPTGNPTKSIENMLKAGADLIIADMEDACPIKLKGPLVREAVVKAFNSYHETYGNTIVTFRPNNPDTPWHDDDLEYVLTHAPNKFHGIIIPKTSTPEAVQDVIKRVMKYSEKGGWTNPPQLEFLIETALGVVNVERIAKVLYESGIGVGLVFGINDFAADNNQPETVEDQNINFLYVKQRIVVAAHAYRLHAMDNIWPILIRQPTEENWNREYPTAQSFQEAMGIYQANYQANDDAFLRKNEEAAKMGMDGTWVIHPSQVKIAHQAFTPTEDQIARAHSLVEEYFRVGGGAITSISSGQSGMADAATVNVAIATLRRGVQAGIFDKEILDQFVAQMAGFIGNVHHHG